MDWDKVVDVQQVFPPRSPSCITVVVIPKRSRSHVFEHKDVEKYYDHINRCQSRKKYKEMKIVLLKRNAL